MPRAHLRLGVGHFLIREAIIVGAEARLRTRSGLMDEPRAELGIVAE